MFISFSYQKKIADGRNCRFEVASFYYIYREWDLYTFIRGDFVDFGAFCHDFKMIFSHLDLRAERKWIYAFCSKFYAGFNAAIRFPISSIIRRKITRTWTPFLDFFGLFFAVLHFFRSQLSAFGCVLSTKCWEQPKITLSMKENGKSRNPGQNFHTYLNFTIFWSKSAWFLSPLCRPFSLRVF